jgi:predicted DNA-binding transcriptional regulator YafY
VHLDLPRWFGSQEEVPCLRDLARALRLGRMLRLVYRPADGREDEPRVVEPRVVEPRVIEPRVIGPLGLVNKAGNWYLVARPDAGGGDSRVFRAGRIGGAVVLAEPFPRPPGFDLAEFWARWSAEFEASRPRIAVTLRASPSALAALPEIFGAAAGPALAAALPPDADGWRAVTLSFEHEVAAAYRLAGFGGDIEVLSPPALRDRLVRTAGQILSRYGTARQNSRVP